MAKAKSKELPHFSKLLNIISEHQKNFDSIYKTSDWRNNVDVLNSLINILVKDTHPELENWWAKKGGYGSSEGANFKNINNKKQRKFIPSKIWKYYAGEMLESENLSYNDHIEKIESKINSLDKRPHFLTEKFCDELYKYFKEYSTFSSVGDMNLRSLETNIRSKNYARFLAEVLFFIAADMPDASGRQINSAPIIKSCNDFFSDILKDLDEGEYYDSYHLEVILTPRIEKETIICETIVVSESRKPNMDKEGDGRFSLSFHFDRKEKINTHKIVAFKVNNKNLIQQIKPDILPDKIRGPLLYGKKYIINDIDEDGYYYIERITRNNLNYPIGKASYRLNYATLKLIIRVYISDIYLQGKALFNIDCSLFTALSQQKRLSSLDLDSKSFAFLYEGFIPKGTGINIIIKPLDDNLTFTPVFIPERESQKHNFENSFTTNDVPSYPRIYGFGGGAGEEEEE
ncbi:hypothetical protein XK27_03250 [Streptococcus suis]|nr:hypothetical protein A7J10_09200 [Streptococcus suis]KPA68143.1 hypothetical protein XK27_03250 [Streptococcus suis]